MNFPARQGMAVWLHSLKHVRQLRKYGNIHYVSKRMKYVVLYCSQDEIHLIKKRIESLPFVKEVQLSELPFLKTEFSNSNREKEKGFEYKMGI